MSNKVRTPLEELNLTDGFLFAETMDEPEAYETWWRPEVKAPG